MKADWLCCLERRSMLDLVSESLLIPAQFRGSHPMKANYTDITIVLDRSGSMESVKQDTIGGFNHFLEEQKRASGTATITLVQFDNEYEVVFRAIPGESQEADPRDIRACGSTALLDAMGRTMDETGSVLPPCPKPIALEKSFS